jgi:hypothetical protein
VFIYSAFLDDNKKKKMLKQGVSQSSGSDLPVQLAPNCSETIKAVQRALATENSVSESSQDSEFNSNGYSAGKPQGSEIEVHPLHMVKHITQGTMATMYRHAPSNVGETGDSDVDVFLLTNDPGPIAKSTSSNLIYKIFKLPLYEPVFLEELEVLLEKHDLTAEENVQLLADIDKLKKTKLLLESTYEAAYKEFSTLRRATGLTEDRVRSYEAIRDVGYVADDGEVEYEYCVSPNEIGYLIYSMPFYEGLDLIGLCCGLESLPLNFVIELMKKIITAVDQLHQRGVAHCDFTPTNLILNCSRDVTIKLLSRGKTHDGEILREYLNKIIVRVIDFGLSKNVSERTQILGSAYRITATIDLLLSKETAEAPANLAQALHSIIPKEQPNVSYYNEEVTTVWLDEFGEMSCMATLLNALPPGALTAHQEADIDNVFREIFCINNRAQAGHRRIDGSKKLTRLLNRLDQPACSLSAAASLFSLPSNNTSAALAPPVIVGYT